MNRHGNPQSLAQARRRDSLDKRARALTAITALEHDAQPITFTAVARAARVSTWLTYAPGVREHIEAAQLRQTRTTPQPSPQSRPSPTTLRAELELARQEIKELRAERDRLKDALRHQLGRQLDDLQTPNPTAQINELAHRNRQLTDQLQRATAQDNASQARITTLEEDLAATRTSLRRMIRDENTN
ncbi:DUF6262 family protein [Embleya sp. NPDC008237]|uniref:DUF6262 family protein n=1 Tax=Embleya sp. NPDC008237 TaxID=3363978 RepID=UPI0036F13D65